MMSGSGIQELLEVVYSSNTVAHMLSGKAVARAVRGHLLVDSALNALIAAKTFNFSLPEEDTSSCTTITATPAAAEGQDTQSSDELPGHAELKQSMSEEMEEGDMVDPETICTDEDLDAVLKLYDKLMKDELTPSDVCQDSSLDRLHQKLEDAKATMQECRTSSLWLQYMDMIGILRQFIKAERTGNWKLHLNAVQNMLPYLAAAGHSLYTKSSYIYLQQMLELEEQQPHVHAAFVSGHHVIRRSDRYWAGLSSDLVIEQTLMRTMKTTGGLTRGRGMDESQLKYLQHKHPFDKDASLQSIATGMTANNTNRDKAKRLIRFRS